MPSSSASAAAASAAAASSSASALRPDCAAISSGSVAPAPPAIARGEPKRERTLPRGVAPTSESTTVWARGCMPRATSGRCAGSTQRMSRCARDAASSLSKKTLAPRAVSSFCRSGVRVDTSTDGGGRPASSKACATTPPTTPPPITATTRSEAAPGSARREDDPVDWPGRAQAPSSRERRQQPATKTHWRANACLRSHRAS
mmetsp:Transcript_34433/g.68568  ORF Transcript_34433/g.68568 Transcript_34433/m.68568 type:complete len:202 (-) Transcript_34433:133-738(-)